MNIRLGSGLRQCAISLLALCTMMSARASDHLDSPTTVANPGADISDVYAWVAPDGRRLNLIMTVLGHAFSDRIEYAIHVDSGKTFGHTTASTSILCQFPSATAVRCTLGSQDVAAGDPTGMTGLVGRNQHLRVYAGLRDDPFYNNIKGLMGAYQAASAAISKGAPVDPAGCAHFDEHTADEILSQMSHTEGGAAQNFLYNWTVSALVVSVDLEAVAQGGKLLAVWGTTTAGGKRIDRMARPFVANTLLGSSPFSTDDPSGVLRQKFNEFLPADSARFVQSLRKSLAFQDSLDGKCGNQVLTESEQTPQRYARLANIFADDRLWVDSSSKVCGRFFAVELAALGAGGKKAEDCGGRAPTYDTSNTWRSLLIAGTTNTISDGLQRDEHPPSATEFPFLAAPDQQAVNH
jgi:Domain of unknown function (DUF4331)